MKTTDAFLEDVLAGLQGQPRTLPYKYLYDERGSELFEQICEVEEYYPTRTELSILQVHAAEISSLIGPHCRLFELGSGSSTKTEVLLAAMDSLAEFVPVDISGEILMSSAERVRERHPELTVTPLVADYSLPLVPPPDPADAARRAVFFAGSTIGNFEKADAAAFLEKLAGLAGPGGMLLIGVDLAKDPDVLEAAYDDSSGVTAAFNLNLLHRMRGELGAELDLDGWRHRARFDPAASRVELGLVSQGAQRIAVAGEAFEFEDGEQITTEYSHKWTLPAFQELAEASGFVRKQVWTDPDDWFSVQLFEVPC